MAKKIEENKTDPKWKLVIAVIHDDEEYDFSYDHYDVQVTYEFVASSITIAKQKASKLIKKYEPVNQMIEKFPLIKWQEEELGSFYKVYAHENSLFSTKKYFVSLEFNDTDLQWESRVRKLNILPEWTIEFGIEYPYNISVIEKHTYFSDDIAAVRRFAAQKAKKCISPIFNTSLDKKWGEWEYDPPRSFFIQEDTERKEYCYIALVYNGKIDNMALLRNKEGLSDFSSVYY